MHFLLNLSFTYLSMRIIFTILILLQLTSFSKAQHIANSKRGSHYTYIFKASDDLAERVFTKRFPKYIPEDFSTLIDSFKVDDFPKANKILPTGHYLYVKGVDEKAEIELASFNNADIKVLNNERDLIVVVYDSTGKECDDAKVYVKHKKLPYDKKTQTYRLKYASRKGMMSVYLRGHASYFILERESVNNNGKLSRKLVLLSYKAPIKYIMWPFRYVVRGIKSPRSFLSPIHNIVRAVRNFQGGKSNIKSQSKGYLVFNKPKYLPKDTVRFKALVLTNNGKAYKQHLDAYYKPMYGRLNEKVLLKTLKPVSPGAYVHEFILPDSLMLNKSYELMLMRGKKIISQNTFALEDYELDFVNYTLRVAKNKFYLGEPVNIYAQGLNSYGKNMMDGKVKIQIQTEKIDEYKHDHVYVPDKIWEVERKLDLVGETNIVLPDSLIPKGVQLTLSLKASFLNSSNELQVQNATFEIMPDEKRILVEVNPDSLLAEYLEWNIKKPKKGKLIIKYANKIGTDTLNIEFPYRAIPQPLALQYKFITDSAVTSTVIAESPSYVSCGYTKTNDSIILKLNNPRKLKVKYFIYNGNREIVRGFADSLTKILPVKNGIYTTSIQYVWGGKSADENFQYFEYKKQLNVSLNQPYVVYPGQSSEVNIKVTDYKNRPVQKANLTAFSVSSQFKKSNIPLLPTFPERIGKEKLVYNRFSSIKTRNPKNLAFINSLGLQEKTHVDTNVYYHFLFPGKNLFQQYNFTEDSISQFSPYVIRKGIPQNISLIYCDNELVYYDKTNTVKTNSFSASAGYHQIKLRVFDRLLTLDLVLIKEGQKLIFSLDLDSLPVNCGKKLLTPQFTPVEKEILENHILILGNTNLPSESQEYVLQRNSLQITSDNFYRTEFKLMGPFPIYSTLQYLRTFDGHSKKFMFEPGFAYYFDKDYLKMKSADLWNIAKPFANRSYVNLNFNDRVLQQRDLIIERDKSQLKLDSIFNFLQKFRTGDLYTNNYNENSCKGKLIYELPENKRSKFILLTHLSSRCYYVLTAYNNTLCNLQPGHYKIGFIYTDGTSQMVDSVSIKLNGTNFLRVNESKNDSVPIEVFLKHFKISCLLGDVSSSIERKMYLDAVKKGNRSIHIVSGRVLDLSGEPIIGATVEDIQEGNGTVTDMDGEYALEVKPNSTLRFSFLGNKSISVPIKGQNRVDVKMDEDSEVLEDVVSIGYAKARVTESLRSVSSKEMKLSNALQGRSTGVQISGAPGTSSSVRIRGVGSANGSEPLYVLDGVVITTSQLNLINPSDIISMEVLKDASATSMYGSRGANGVVLITTKNGGGKRPPNKSNIQTAVKDSMPDLQSIPAGIRSDFKDYGYWSPNLVTDKKGEAKFKVTFPGNITSWNTHVLAVDFKKKSGSVQQTTLAFKPLMAELASPRFLIYGDEAMLIGKVSNYTGDTVNIKTSISIDSTAADTANIALVGVHNVYHKVTAGNKKDTLNINFNLKYGKYQDGELRKIPVFPIGVEETKGEFMVLDKDTTFTIDASKYGGNMEISAVDNPIKVLREEINRVRNYEYLCAEQLSSKLLACLQEKIICTALDEKFKYQQEILKLIQRLKDAQHQDGTWGWWKAGNTNFRMTAYVFKALSKAETMGYKMPFFDKTKEVLPHLLDAHDNDALLVSLNSMADLGTKLNYAKYLSRFDTLPLSMHQSLKVISLKQKLGLPYNLTFLKENKKETIFGANYWGEVNYSWYDNSVPITLEVYKIFKKHDSTDVTLRKIRQYFFESRTSTGWRNTYESASIIETILLDVLKANKPNEVKSSIVIKGDVKDSIISFPYHRKFRNASKIEIVKKGKAPMFLSVYTRQWNKNPIKNEKDFLISTSFENKNGKRLDELTAGEAITMTIQVRSKQSFDYIMIEVPIPAGCSYGNNERMISYGEEIHREYFKHKTSIFVEKMSEGSHTYKINLEPRFTGKYTLNPSKIELMYFPVFYGREAMKKIVIE